MAGRQTPCGTSPSGFDDWWVPFFSGPAACVQQRAKSEEETRAEADHIKRVLRVPKGARLLGVPCGNGRLALALATSGYDVVGVDCTPSLIEAARSAASRAGAQASYACMDMCRLDWREGFDAAFSFWVSFGYFDDEGNLDFLNAVSRSLKLGGRLLLETQTLETMLPRFSRQPQCQVGDMLVLEERRYDPAHSAVEAKTTFVCHGEAATFPTRLRVYTYRELCGLFETVGLTRCTGYDSVSTDPFQLGARRLALDGPKNQGRR